ncbi:MAG: CpaF family protein [Endomicrobiia bacterium]|nr:CpaF family protein [Endomicrobiia bacterium]
MTQQYMGPLEEYFADDTVTEVMVNGLDHVYIERAGKLTLTDKKFVDNKEMFAVIDAILKPIGRCVNEETPLVDARLLDGSRVNIVIPPISLIGPMITIRKFSKKRLVVDDLIKFGALTKKMAEFINLCVSARKNVIISGGTGSGKTTLLNVASSYIPEDERILTVEDTAELRLNQTHVGRLEGRPADLEGKGAISIRHLVINALRMRPDRIVVGECRGGEALDMLQAMNTGHDGSMTTVHANTPRDALKRLEVMVLMAGYDLPVRAIREQISSAVNVIVQLSRLSDGSRKVVDISQVTGMEGDTITMGPIFKYVQSGLDPNTGKVVGEFRATGATPTFLEEVKAKGIKFDMAMFRNES